MPDEEEKTCDAVDLGELDNSFKKSLELYKADIEQLPDYQLDNESIVKRIQSGEQELMQILFVKTSDYMIAAAYRAARFYSELDCAVNADDLMQSAWESITEAVKSYKPESGACFKTWYAYYLKTGFSRCTGKRITMTPENRQRYYKLLQHDSLDRKVKEDDDTVISDFIPDEAAELSFEAMEQRIYTEQLHAELVRNIAQLKPKQQNVINKRYFQDMSFPAIAAEESCSVEWASQLHDDALMKMKKLALRCTGDFKSRLEEYLDDHTNFYHGTPETLSIHRENIRLHVMQHPEKIY